MSLQAVLEPEPSTVAHRPRADRDLDLLEALTSAINDLPPGARTVLVLRDVEGLSNLEIAEVLGLSAPSVKARVHRARLFLRRHLGDAMTTLDATAAPLYGS